MARRESLTTPAGTISFLLPSDERVSELSQRWPFQLSAISDRDDRNNERAEFFLPFSDAAGVLAGVYLPQVPAAARAEAEAVIGFDRLVAARSLAALARSEIRGVVLCCVTCREQEGALVLLDCKHGLVLMRGNGRGRAVGGGLRPAPAARSG